MSLRAAGLPASPGEPFDPIQRLSLEAVSTAALLEAVRLAIFDLLESPTSVASLAAAKERPESTMAALLEALLARGLVERVGDEYLNTPATSEYLVRESSLYQGDALLLHAPGVERVVCEFGSLLREPGTTHGEVKRHFDSGSGLLGARQNALRGLVQDTVASIAALPDFSAMRLLCDVGGGHGQYAMSLLDLSPGLSAVIAELPNVVPVVEGFCAEAGYGERLRVLPWDLRADAGPVAGCDLALASHVLHLFAADLVTVLRRIRAVLRPGGWLVIQYMDYDRADPLNRTAMELLTVLTAGVRHFTSRGDLEVALAEAGFVEPRGRPTGRDGASAVLAARRA